MRRWYAGAGFVLVLGLLALAGCGATGTSGTASSAASGGGTGGGTGGGGGGDQAAYDAGAAPAQADAESVALARVVPAERSLVRTAQLSVRVQDLAAAAARATSLTRTAGGIVAAEQTTATGPAEPGQSSYTLRVPPEALDRLLDQLAALGTLLDRQVGTEDVTAQVVDLDSRLASQRASVERVRALLARAQTVGDVVTVEGQLARREADLESLQARSRVLGGQVALATVELSLYGHDSSDGERDRGFVVGLESGWSAFGAGTALLVTALGASLPFLAALVVVGAVVVAGRRVLARRRRQAPAVV